MFCVSFTTVTVVIKTLTSIDRLEGVFTLESIKAYSAENRSIFCPLDQGYPKGGLRPETRVGVAR